MSLKIGHSPLLMLGDRLVGPGRPTYFIADIAANHDGDLARAKELIHLAAEAGADAAKFQHFKAETIVSGKGFDSLGVKSSHQADWAHSVFDVYKAAEVPTAWNEDLKSECERAGIDFFSAPYNFEAVDELNRLGVPAHKIGSGDITWLDMVNYIGESGKPVFLATGASTLEDVERAVSTLQKSEVPICLMQCNTNYTGDLENFKNIHLNVLRTYQLLFPDVVLGLSDHTPGHATCLGAIALGASAIEKHFTDDAMRAGPDHKFSMDPKGWAEMVDRARELEYALGSTRKFVANNEKETVVLQRRCLRFTRSLAKGTVLRAEHLTPLRPAPNDAIFPYEIGQIIGKRLLRPMTEGSCIKRSDFE